MKKVSETGFIGLQDYQDFPVTWQLDMMQQTAAGDDEKKLSTDYPDCIDSNQETS